MHPSAAADLRAPATTDLASFGLIDVVACTEDVRRLGEGRTSMEEVAQLVVEHLRDRFVDASTGGPAVRLARLYVTQPHASLDEDLRARAVRSAGGRPLDPGTTCLTLLGTTGAAPGWCSRHASVDHGAIALPTLDALDRSPMILHLFRQLGLDPVSVVEPAATPVVDEGAFDVFFVPEALDSAEVPAQAFVLEHGIRSVVGFGGVLPGGGVFTVLLFAGVPVSRATADLFAPIALAVKVALLPFVGGAVLAGAAPAPPAPGAAAVGEGDVARARAAALEQLLAVQAAVVHAQSARLLESQARQARIASTLQASLLPPALPEVRGYDLAATYRAAGEGLDVGGDFYDVFELVEGHWGVVLGDVCGRGTEAAVVTSLVRHTARAAAVRDRAPLEVLAAVNDAVHRQHPERYCTAAYAALDVEAGEATLCLGGHPRPVVLRADGTAEEVGRTGRLLGPFDPWVGSSALVPLGPGDALVLFSDGVTESRWGDEFFGEGRLLAALRGASGGTAGELVAAVASAVDGFADELDDDLAILAVRRRPLEGRAVRTLPSRAPEPAPRPGSTAS